MSQSTTIQQPRRIIFRPSSLVSANLTAICAFKLQCTELVDSIFMGWRITGSPIRSQTLLVATGPDLPVVEVQYKLINSSIHREMDGIDSDASSISDPG